MSTLLGVCIKMGIILQRGFEPTPGVATSFSHRKVIFVIIMAWRRNYNLLNGTIGDGA